MKKYMLFGILALVLQLSQAQTSAIKLGAYYFDGWKKGSKHVTKALVDSFPERKPVWGWVTSTPEAVKSQIDLASNAGISFFSFCWYYAKSNPDAGNQALSYYLDAPNKSALQFNLMVVNHEGFTIRPEDWPDLIPQWIKLFKDPQYLKIQRKPYIAFFSINSLVKAFGSAEAVNKAFDELRSAAKTAGFSGVEIGGCPSPDTRSIALAQNCGFDILTGYNYPGVGLKDTKTPINSLIDRYSWTWKQFENSHLPYIPVATLNWDNRPWRTGDDEKKARHFVGYSSASVYQSVKALKTWLDANPDKTTKERIALLYAWNEYGEGAWLTPSANSKDNLLDGVKKAMNKN
ncbi:hypothetical protein GS399_14180 [Pedobacter sp. HMF7647]|uniref:Glycosyltransferase WbsX n=1 Tax=Hufsiella arboris TaxID=2695275 RepID=A0A7K1YBZ2_9SPHI|nr:glycoside hydrolase family 99-like domain-containing protein [Hufsiella arboris]MXV52122.1 hypothetical protein [Hufsiella arboris]